MSNGIWTAALHTAGSSADAAVHVVLVHAGRRLRWLRASVALVCAGLVFSFAARFPWHATASIVADAHWSLLPAAVTLNLAAIFAKGWAWHLVLPASASHRFRSTQLATFVGAAVNCVAVLVGSDAARVHVLAQRDGVGYRTSVVSIVVARVLETVALALLVGVAAALLPRETWADGVRFAAWSLLAVGFAVWWWGLLPRLVAKLPATIRAWTAPFGAIRTGARLAPPIALGVVTWLAKWAVIDLCLRTTGIAVPAATSLTALLLANLGGIAHLTPGNIGVLQGALLIALAPFGVGTPQALGAGLILQAVLTVPVVLIGAALGARALAAPSAPTSRSSSGSGAPISAAASAVRCSGYSTDMPRQSA